MAGEKPRLHPNARGRTFYQGIPPKPYHWGIKDDGGLYMIPGEAPPESAVKDGRVTTKDTLQAEIDRIFGRDTPEESEGQPSD